MHPSPLALCQNIYNQFPGNAHAIAHILHSHFRSTHSFSRSIAISISIRLDLSQLRAPLHLPRVVRVVAARTSTPRTAYIATAPVAPVSSRSAALDKTEDWGEEVMDRGG